MLDASVYKRLSSNDTGSAPGHQAGILIPKDISQFFPFLPDVSGSTGPTVSEMLTADLFIGDIFLGTVDARYQHQTWGGTRSAERRLTGNLGPLRNQAVEGDIILFNKDLDVDSHIQLRLLRQGTAGFSRTEKKLGPARWGVVDPDAPPVSTDEIRAADQAIDREAEGPAFAFASDRRITETVTMRRARDRAFRGKVLEQYDYRCAFSGLRFVSPASPRITGLDAAHIVPVHSRGSDHPANGFPLTKDLHWAFDRGLLSVTAHRTILVPARVRELEGNEFIADLDGRPIREAATPGLRALDEALEWHRQNILIRESI